MKSNGFSAQSLPPLLSQHIYSYCYCYDYYRCTCTVTCPLPPVRRKTASCRHFLSALTVCRYHQRDLLIMLRLVWGDGWMGDE